MDSSGKMHSQHAIEKEIIAHEKAEFKPSKDEDHVRVEAIGGTSADLPRGYYRSFNFIGTVAAFCLANMSEYCGYILTFNLLPIINAEIGEPVRQVIWSTLNLIRSPGPSPNIVWEPTGYTLAIGVSCLIWGRLSDIFGRRWFFIGGNALALIGSILGATAQNATTLIWGQVFIGLSFPAQLSFSIALAELIPNSYRGHMNGLLFLAAVPFSTFGPVIARQVQQNTAQGWRWAYYINLILVGSSMALAYVCYHPPNFQRLHTRITKTDVFKNLDYLGIILFTAGVALTLTGLNWGGQQYPSASGHTLGTLIGGLALMAIFVFWEIFGAREPLLPMRFMTNLPFVGLVLAASAGSAVFYPLNLIWPQQITALYSTSPSPIGWLSCAVGGGALLGQVLCGLFIKLLGHQKWQLVFTASAMTAFIAGMAATNQNNKNTALALTILGSVMLGYVENMCLTLAPFVLEDKDIGLAIGILSSTRTWIAGIALAIYSIVLNNNLAQFVPDMVGPAVEQAGLDSGSLPALLMALPSRVVSGVPGMTTEIAGVAIEAYQMRFRGL